MRWISGPKVVFSMRNDCALKSQARIQLASFNHEKFLKWLRVERTFRRLAYFSSLATTSGSFEMAIKKGGAKRLERKQPPPPSLGGSARQNAEQGSVTSDRTVPYHQLQEAAKAKGKESNAFGTDDTDSHYGISGAASESSDGKQRKRGQAKSASARRKQERGMDNAARLVAKAAKRTARTEKRKRSKEAPR